MLIVGRCAVKEKFVARAFLPKLPSVELLSPDAEQLLALAGWRRFNFDA